MWQLYLDESGDLGFNFADKSPSKFLTISVLAVNRPTVAKAISAAIKKTLRRKVNTKKKRELELKGTGSTIEVKRYFYSQIKDLEFGVYALTMEKRGVYEHLCDTTARKGRLYNYIANQVLKKIPFENECAPVELIVDKSKSRAEISDFNQYVLKELEGRVDPRCSVNIYHRESCEDLGLSASDLFCWGIFRRHERDDEEWYAEYRTKVLCDERYL